MSTDDRQPNCNPVGRPRQRSNVYRPDILKVIEDTIDSLVPELRRMSNTVHADPQLAFQETTAHDTYTAFMESQGGWTVIRHYLPEIGGPTAWVATYTHGQGGRVLGVNSEMDALPEIGHACGHNLIGIAGVAVACAAKAAMEKFSIDGKVILLGTPAEESGSGKIQLYNRGAYDEMDVCLMTHPAKGPSRSVSLSSTLAKVGFEVRYTGQAAHAGLSPWEGKNALDAAVLAYQSIGLLRQQIKPDYRVHGIFGGEDWAPNVIPDNSKVQWAIRAPTTEELKETKERVKECFRGAATATGTHVEFIEDDPVINELKQNKVLGEELTDVIENHLGGKVNYDWGISGGSTDFGNISNLMPGLHPAYAIPTAMGNHTKEFAAASATDSAHNATYAISKALAHVGMRVLTDEDFYQKVKVAFDNGEIARLE